MTSHTKGMEDPLEATKQGSTQTICLALMWTVYNRMEMLGFFWTRCELQRALCKIINFFTSFWISHTTIEIVIQLDWM